MYIELSDIGNSIGARIGGIFFKTLLHLGYTFTQLPNFFSLFTDYDIFFLNESKQAFF